MADAHRAWGRAELEALAGCSVAVVSDSDAREAVSRDFGRIRHAEPAAVAMPRSAAEVAAILSFANAHGLPVTPRGGGLSQGGQSLPPASGLVLDLRRIDTVESFSKETVTAGAGARFRQLVAVTHPLGWEPSVLPMNLDLTLGGVVSAGGVGTRSHHAGFVASNVVELEVVTAQGEIVVCSESHNAPLFDAVRGTLGQIGVVTRVAMNVRKLEPTSVSFRLVYEDVSRWLADLKHLAGTSCVHLEAFATPLFLGMRGSGLERRPAVRWSYVTVFSFAGEDVGRAALGGIAAENVVAVEEVSSRSFASRFDPRFEFMHESGVWRDQHPWTEAFLDLGAVEAVLPQLLERLPSWLLETPRLQLVEVEDAPPLVALPKPSCDATAAPRKVAALALVPAGIRTELAGRARAELDWAHRAMMEAGGVRYLSGWLDCMTSADWENHFGSCRRAWRDAKASFDPRGTLSSTVFTSPQPEVANSSPAGATRPAP